LPSYFVMEEKKRGGSYSLRGGKDTHCFALSDGKGKRRKGGPCCVKKKSLCSRHGGKKKSGRTWSFRIFGVIRVARQGGIRGGEKGGGKPVEGERISFPSFFKGGKKKGDLFFKKIQKKKGGGHGKKRKGEGKKLLVSKEKRGEVCCSYFNVSHGEERKSP